MKVGSVKEIKQNEFRIGLTPNNVSDYKSNGHEVFIEAGAGVGSGFSDDMYKAAGATILGSAKEVWSTCDMIVKVKEPLEPEYSMMKEGQIIYTYLHLAADRPLTEALLKNKVKAVAYETVTDNNGGLPLLKPMSEVAGKVSIQAGARSLEKLQGGAGVLLGGVPGTRKANVMVIGGGAVGVSAMKMAMGLGANVTIFDNNLDRLTYLDDVFGSKIQTMYSTPAKIAELLPTMDLVVGAVLLPGGAAAPKLIKKEHLKTMKPGSVIVDVAIDQGGCAETSRVTYHSDPVFIEDGVVHYCVANMPGAVPQTSTVALTNATLSIGLKIANMGVEAACRADKNIIPGVNCYSGHLVNEPVAKEFGIELKNLMDVLA